MIKAVPIEFLRQVIEQTLFEEHLKNQNLFGGENQIRFATFYEQLKNDNELERFNETYRGITDEQNRTGLIGAGMLLSPDNPTFTNLYSALIIPFTFTGSVRCSLENRDQMLWSLQNMIDKLKGRKCDVAQLECEDINGRKIAKLFKVGTLGQGETLAINSGDFIGGFNYNQSVDTQIKSLISTNTAKGLSNNITNGKYLYFQKVGAYALTNAIKVARFNGTDYIEIEDDGTYDDIVFPPEHDNFEKYKLSMSFDSFRIDEPHTLNGEDYCQISFGGSATLVNDSVVFGNDLVKLTIHKNKIIADNVIDLSSSQTYFLEPLELPSGLNANSQISQLMSNNFKQNSHTDGTAGNLQYTFILDKSIPILKQWFEYGRFGAYGITTSSISPNMIYDVIEFWSSWGNVEKHSMLGKITESIDVENTESDVLTIGVTFQIQGANN